MKAYILPASIITLAIALLLAVFFYNSQSAVGSVMFGSEYQSTVVTTGTSTAKTIAGTLGSVVIHDAGTTGSIDLYATSTIYATSSADLIFSIDGAAAEGTYTFDVGFGNGLQIDSAGFDGTAVITFR